MVAAVNPKFTPREKQLDSTRLELPSVTVRGEECCTLFSYFCCYLIHKILSSCSQISSAISRFTFHDIASRHNAQES